MFNIFGLENTALFDSLSIGAGDFCKKLASKPYWSNAFIETKEEAIPFRNSGSAQK